ncbi:MAG: co-chaperone GroES [Spirochaetes bacterium]|nr:co-chaperone GroES [Spirochaetota bacterium]
MDIKVTPLDDRAIVKQLEEQDEKVGSIYIPDSAKEKPQEGKVLAVGPGKMTDDGKRIAMDIKVGDTVIYAKYGGTEFKYKGEEYIILQQSDILAKLKK